MAWNDIVRYIIAFIGSLGGMSAVVMAIVHFSADKIAQHLQEKYDLRLKKELEEYKSDLENKNHISKTRFDAEFAIYRELSVAFFTLIRDMEEMIPVGVVSRPLNEEAREKWISDAYDKFRASFIKAQDVLYRNAPFISKNLLEKHEELLVLCRMQINAYERRWDVGYFPAPGKSKHNFEPEDYDRSKVIHEKHGNLMDEMREYLSKLEVSSD